VHLALSANFKAACNLMKVSLPEKGHAESLSAITFRVLTLFTPGRAKPKEIDRHCRDGDILMRIARRCRSHAEDGPSGFARCDLSAQPLKF